MANQTLRRHNTRIVAAVLKQVMSNKLYDWDSRKFIYLFISSIIVDYKLNV